MYKNRQFEYIGLALIILFVILVSLPTLTTRPRLWADEAKSIELALNFWRFGILDIQTAPGEFSGIPHLLQSTGYPVTIPLAGLFALFGFSMETARIYMLFWMIAALLSIFFFLRRLFGAKEALFAVALIATFASFHDNGRTVVGEIPGFLFMIIGLWILLFSFKPRNLTEVLFLKCLASATGASTRNFSAEKYPCTAKIMPKVSFVINHIFITVAGLFFGLAVVTKPSIYMAALPAIAIALYFRNKNIKQWFIDVFFVAIGSVIPALLWLLVIVGNPFNTLFWKDILLFWQNPFSAASTSENIVANLRGMFLSTTLIYFGALFVLLLCAAKSFWRDEPKRIFFVFVTLYSALAFLYYLRSPGWLRYIIAAELLILMIAPRVFYEFGTAIAQKFKTPRLAYISIAALFLLIIIHIIHFFTAAQIYTSDVALRIGKSLHERYPTQTIVILNEPIVALFIPPERKYQVVEMVGLPVLGRNLLLFDSLPDVVLSAGDGRFLAEARGIVSSFYTRAEDIQGYSVFAKTTLP